MATPISSFRNKVIPHVPGCPWPKIDEVVVDALRKFCEDTYLIERGIESEDIDYTTIDATDNDAITINLASHYTGYDPIVPVEFQIDGAPYHLQELYLYNDNSNLDSITLPGIKFFNFPTTASMKIFPFTGQGANFDIYLKLALKPSLAVTTVDDLFFNNWADAIEFLAAGILQGIPERPWYNPDRAALNLGLYQIKKGDAKLLKNMGFAKGSQAIKGGYF